MPFLPPNQQCQSTEGSSISNKIITLKNYFTTASWGPLKKNKNPGAWARAQCAHWLRRPWRSCVKLCRITTLNEYQLLTRATVSCCRQSLTITFDKLQRSELGGIVNLVDRRWSSLSRSERPLFSSEVDNAFRRSICRSKIF